jgi:hypothetical protein
MRGTNVQLRTSFSAGLLPPLRQTASCVAGIFVLLKVCQPSKFHQVEPKIIKIVKVFFIFRKKFIVD